LNASTYTPTRIPDALDITRPWRRHQDHRRRRRRHDL